MCCRSLRICEQTEQATQNKGLTSCTSLSFHWTGCLLMPWSFHQSCANYLTAFFWFCYHHAYYLCLPLYSLILFTYCLIICHLYTFILIILTGVSKLKAHDMDVSLIWSEKLDRQSETEWGQYILPQLSRISIGYSPKTGHFASYKAKDLHVTRRRAQMSASACDLLSISTLTCHNIRNIEMDWMILIIATRHPHGVMTC